MACQSQSSVDFRGPSLQDRDRLYVVRLREHVHWLDV